MQDIYIILSFSGTLFSKFLKAISELTYPHVSISLHEDIRVAYSFGRKIVRNPLIGGFVEEHQNKGVYAVFDSDCKILKLTITDEQYNKLLTIIEKFKSNSKVYKYNYMGLVYTYFNRPQNLRHRFTCTQFVATVLKESGIADFGKPASLVRSDEYNYIPGVKLIYKGKFNAYKVNNLMLLT